MSLCSWHAGILHFQIEVKDEVTVDALCECASLILSRHAVM